MNKTLKVMTSAALLAGITTPVAVTSVDAATDNNAIAIPSVSGTANGVTLGTLRLTETEATVDSITSGDVITVTLPQGAEWAAAPGIGIVTGNFGGFTLISTSTKSITFRVNDNGAAFPNKSFINVALNGIDLDGVTGDVKVNVYAPNTGISQGDVTVATASTGSATATALTSPSVARATGVVLGTIRIAETRAGAFAAGNNIDIIAPDDVTFTAAALQGGAPVNGLVLNSNTPAPSQDADGFSRIRYTVNTATAAGATPGFFDVVITANVSSDFDLGDLKVKVKGDNVTATELVVAKAADFGVELKAEDAKTVYAGSAGQKLSTLKIKELMANSVLAGRSLTFELPSYAHFQAKPTIDVKKGNVDLDGAANDQGTLLNATRTKLSFSPTNGGTLSEIDLKDWDIFLDADAPEGDLVVKVSGSQGINQELTLAKVVKPVTVNADMKNVIIGVQDQVSGDIEIKEAAAGTIKAVNTTVNASNNWGTGALATTANVGGTVTLTAPTGVTFASTPDVTVSAGNLKVAANGVSLNTAKNQLTITIDKSSSEASTLKLSNVKFTVDRTVPEGQVKLTLSGTSLDKVGNNTDAVVESVVANVTTPAPGNASSDEVKFTIGSTEYTVGSETKTMDLAPFVEAGRTYMPIRYVAEAVGADFINWDQATQTATVIKGDRVAELKAGSKSLKINGGTITMDAAAKVKEGRTVLPVRFVGQALGAKVDWNEATQTVTVK